MKLRVSGSSLWMWCPACEDAHRITVGTPDSWTWDGNTEQPTISPSIKVTGAQWPPEFSFYKPNTLVREFPPLDPTADKGRVCWQLCNPSTADARVNDPTVRKGIGFALRWGYSSIEFVNRAAFRATNPKALLSAADPIGPDNARHIAEAFDRADLIVFAWGKAWPTKLDRLSPAQSWPGAMCLGRNGDRSPRHPLMLAYSTPLEPWVAPTCVHGECGPHQWPNPVAGVFCAGPDVRSGS